MVSSNPQVSVVIPVYNGEATLRGCLESILRQQGVSFEVVVVDDGSTDGTVDVLRDFGSHVVVLCNPSNMGIAKTYNRGIRGALAPVLMLVASDCSLVSPDHLRRSLHILESQRDVGIVTGKPVMPGFMSMGWAPRLFAALNRLEILDPSCGTVEVNFTEARCDMLRKEVVQKAGMFNEHLDRSNEDQDLSIKVRQLGFRLLQDNTLEFVLEHGGTSDSFLKLLRKQVQYARGQAYISVNYGVGNRGAGLRENRNRLRRAILRGAQAVTAAAVVSAVVAAWWVPAALWIAASVLAMRSLSHAWFTARRLGLSETLGAVTVGPVCDLLYGSAFLFHCLLWTLKGKSSFAQAPHNSCAKSGIEATSSQGGERNGSERVGRNIEVGRD